MIVEWYFLVSIMTGTFDPQTGWQHVQHLDYAAPSYEACLNLQEGIILDIRERLKGGEGAVITGCQQRGR